MRARSRHGSNHGEGGGVEVIFVLVRHEHDVDFVGSGAGATEWRKMPSAGSHHRIGEHVNAVEDDEVSGFADVHDAVAGLTLRGDALRDGHHARLLASTPR